MAALEVVVLPGFTRAPHHLQRLTDACVARGWPVHRPLLAPRLVPVLYMDRRRLQRIADAVAIDVGPSPLVVAGHSAGGAAGAYLAAMLGLRGSDVRGVVLIDGVESPNHLIARSMDALRGAGVRIAAVLAEPSPCNRHGRLATLLERVPEARVELVPGAGHGAIEGAGVEVYRRACGDRTSPETADAFLESVLTAIDWAAGSPPAQPAGPR